MLTSNFHTHTVRCGHAEGSDREYVEAAIKAGIKVLGFSDHAPYSYPFGFRSSCRMPVNEAENYVKSVRALQKEYCDSIDIYLGFETEYYPELFDGFLKKISRFDVDYMILGQHFLRNEYDGKYVLGHGNDADDLKAYVNQTIEGMETGKFAYVAHPDVFRYEPATKDKASSYEEEMFRLCVAAKRCGMPLEFNFLGFENNRIYPSERFFKIAAEVGNEVIYGVDAHSPSSFFGASKLAKRADKILDGLKIKRTQNIKLLNGKKYKNKRTV